MGVLLGKKTAPLYRKTLNLSIKYLKEDSKLPGMVPIASGSIPDGGEQNLEPLVMGRLDKVKDLVIRVEEDANVARIMGIGGVEGCITGAEAAVPGPWQKRPVGTGGLCKRSAPLFRVNLRIFHTTDGSPCKRGINLPLPGLWVRLMPIPDDFV